MDSADGRKHRRRNGLPPESPEGHSLRYRFLFWLQRITRRWPRMPPMATDAFSMVRIRPVCCTQSRSTGAHFQAPHYRSASRG